MFLLAKNSRGRDVLINTQSILQVELDGETRIVVKFVGGKTARFEHDNVQGLIYNLTKDNWIG
jgi:hypothetical protein